MCVSVHSGVDRGAPSQDDGVREIKAMMICPTTSEPYLNDDESMTTYGQEHIRK